MRAKTALELGEYAPRKEHDVGTTNLSNTLELTYMYGSQIIISLELDLKFSHSFFNIGFIYSNLS